MSLVKLLQAATSGGPYYVRIRRDRLSVRNASGSGYFEDEPLVALTADSPPKIEAIGAVARSAGVRYVNPFSHPRVLVEDFLVAEKLLQHAFRVVSGPSLLRPAPIAVMHPTEELEGGLSAIESRVLRELAEGAGARKAYIWTGRELTDEELRSGLYEQEST